MSFLTKVWRIPVLALGLAVFATACSDDDGAEPPSQPAPPVTGTISGQVTASDDGTGIVGALVGTSPATTTALTDANGNFTITNIPIPSGGSASFAVTASKEGFQSGTNTVTLSSTAPTGTANITMVRITEPEPPPDPTMGNLNVLVTNREGTAQSGVDVQIVCVEGFTATATTNDDGFALFQDIQQGACTVSAETLISGIPFRASGGVNVRAGETAFLQLSLARDFGQSVFPNIEGEAVDLRNDANATIRFVNVTGVGHGVPEIDCNIIRTQHLYIAEVVDGEGEPVSGVKVEWDLNTSENGTITIECPDLAPDPAGCSVPTVPGNTGSIVDSDDPDLDPAQARSGLSPAFNVDTRKAVSFTNDDGSQTVRFGSQTVTIGRGQTWLLITSPVEGITDVIASTSDLAVHDPACALNIDSNGSPLGPCDKAIAIKRWVNWDTGVYELDWPNARFDGDPDPASEPGALDPTDDTDATFTPIADGGLVTNILDRRETDVEGGCTSASPDCELTGNRALFFGRVQRLRNDSPFNIARGVIAFDVTDDSPNVQFWGEDATNGGNAGDDGSSVGVPNVEFNGPSDDQYWVGPQGKPSGTLTETDRDRAAGEFDANNNVFDGGLAGTNPACAAPSCDEDDFLGWVVAEARLDPAVFFCTDGNGNGICDPTNEPEDSFSEQYVRLIEGTIDNTNEFRVRFIDEFGEVCAETTFRKRWVTSRLQVIKNVPGATRQTFSDFDGKSVKTHTVEVNQTFSYTVTAINDGDDASVNVRITDTLPRFNGQGEQFSMPHDPIDRSGSQAFLFLNDRPTFDPVAIVYGIDESDDDPGPSIDVCIRGDDGSTAALSYAEPSVCPSVQDEGTIDAARAEAVDRSAAGDQVVWIQWFDDVIARGLEPEDSVEIFLSADSDLYTSVSIPDVWCNIATATDGPSNDGTDSIPQSLDADTLCHRVILALLDTRKTTLDAVISAGAAAQFRIEVANGGSATLRNTVVTDTIDQSFGHKLRSTDIDVECTGCDFPDATVSIIPTTFTAGDSVAFSITIGDLPAGTSFDPDGDVAIVTVPTPNFAGIFCNRETVRGTTGAGDQLSATDLACVTTTVSIEMDVANDDGLIIPETNEFSSDKEIFSVGDGAGSSNELIYRVVVTNQSASLSATGVSVTDVVSPTSSIISCNAVLGTTPGDPAFGITAGSANPTTGSTGGCTTFGDGTEGFVWTIGTLPPGGRAILYFRAEAQNPGNDVNRVILTADQLTGEIIADEPTTIQ